MYNFTCLTVKRTTHQSRARDETQGGNIFFYNNYILYMLNKIFYMIYTYKKYTIISYNCKIKKITYF